MNLELYIARRLFHHSGDARRVSHSAIQIATAGVAVGVMVMIISICMVMGFKHEIQSKVYGFGGHLRVINYQSMMHPVVIDDSITSSLTSITNVKHVQRFAYKQGLLKTDSAFCGVMFRGIGPEFDRSFFESHLVAGEVPIFSDTVSTGKLLLSESRASQLKIRVGDKIYGYFFEKTVRARRFTVAGIYSTNLTDFDNAFVFVDLNTTQSLQNWDPNQCSGVDIFLDDNKKMNIVNQKVVSLVNHKQDAYGAYYMTLTAHELYPHIFSWLSLLDTNIVVILILMVCVAGFTMISGLLIIILERTNFIGIMKALGAHNRRIQSLFLYFSSFIVFRGLFLGNLIALLLVALQKHFGIIRLDPETYYVDVMPLQIDWFSILCINIATLVVCMMALLLPSLLVSNIHPARSIRFE